jgi:glycosyltransferase involved in cell wall biosynthesis
LSIAGQGPELERLLQQVARLEASESIRFLGYRDEMNAIYKEADCLLHVCAHEAFGRVVVEAANCGLVRVVSQSGGAGELVTNEETGLTFRPNDLLDCVRALKCAYNLTVDSFERICLAAQRETRANSSPEGVADAYHRLATEMLSD